MNETKIIYHIDDEETPYLVKLSIAPEKVTLADFKNVLNRPNYKFFFKSMDDDFGVVKEEIIDDDAHLPCFNGRVVSWLVSAEGSNLSDGTSQCTESASHSDGKNPPDRILDAHHPMGHHSLHGNQEDLTYTETDSIISSRPGGHHGVGHQEGKGHDKYDKYNKYNGGSRVNGIGGKGGRAGYESSLFSSDLETTSFLESDEDDLSSRITTTTGRATNLSVDRNTIESGSVVCRRRRAQRRRRKAAAPVSRTSSYSSITDSTMSLNIITVTLNMDTVNFLGISIVGQSNKGGDGGIYVGSIMKGGAVALDGRIEPGDMILQVNDINFEDMSNDEAVRILREVVQKPGPIKLVVAKCWDPNPKGYFTIPRTEPVRPIDPGAWVAHTAAIIGDTYPLRPPSVSTLTSTSSSITSSIPDIDRPLDDLQLNINSDMLTVVRAMARPDSGLEIRDRMWLKITIPNAFIGADIVDWVETHIAGIVDKRDARKYASQLLKAGYIRHTVNKITFSEQCYYIFGDLLSSEMSNLTLDGEVDTVGPLPPPAWGGYNSVGGVSGVGAPPPPAFLPPPPPTGYNPLPYNNQCYTNEPSLYSCYTREESAHSGSGGSSGGAGGSIGKGRRDGGGPGCREGGNGRRAGSGGGSSNGGRRREGGAGGSSSSPTPSSATGATTSNEGVGGEPQTVSSTSIGTTTHDSHPPPNNQQDLSSSRQSFRTAMANP